MTRDSDFLFSFFLFSFWKKEDKERRVLAHLHVGNRAGCILFQTKYCGWWGGSVPSRWWRWTCLRAMESTWCRVRERTDGSGLTSIRADPSEVCCSQAAWKETTSLSSHGCRCLLIRLKGTGRPRWSTCGTKGCVTSRILGFSITRWSTQHQPCWCLMGCTVPKVGRGFLHKRYQGWSIKL